MLAPIIHILPLTTIHRERTLPMTGRVVARLDQKVSPSDVVAEASLGREHALIDVARVLGISSEEADKLIKCRVGERLQAGYVVAQRAGLVPVVARVPKDGRVVAVGGGQILMETSGGTFELRAGIPGTILQLVPERGAEIVVHGSLIQGVWGNGRVDQGLLFPVMETPGDCLVASQVDVSLRGSILAIGEGQMMAGRSIGMSRWATVFNVILPQALRLAIPAWANEPVSLLKSTSVVFLIAVPELMARAKAIAARTYDSISAYIAVAIIYLAMVYLVDAVMKWAERASRIPGFEMEGRKT